MTVQMGVLILALLGLSTALVCPDGGVCEDKNTCCKNTEGGYGCCPLPNAECCSDHLHCCFEGTLCDLVHQKCVNKTVSLPWMKRVPIKQAPLVPQLQLVERVKAVICPDQESECPDGTTCCQLPNHSWGCCPLAKAVCCDDKRHCCPEGTQCDLVHSKCVSPLLDSFPMLEKLPARRRENKPVSFVGSVACPGGRSSCPDSYTCCLLTSGDYGCCPYPEATCCSDHLHCCPSNAVCDLEHQICRSGDTHVPLMKKIPAVPNDVVCPDKKTACPDETTCCQMTNGTYGCCPMPDAVCCSDHIHCCPAGTQCDLQHSTCVSAVQGDVEMITAVARQESTERKVHAVPCNDSVACADGNTCCKSPGGQWACCPLPKAVCCQDKLHCCPHGTICNLAASTCDSTTGNAMMPWLDKVPVFPLLTDNNKCDESTSCPGTTTCCKTQTGQWACCPLPQAVCCEDHIHCCPQDTVCNLEAGTCDDPSGAAPSLSWMEKLPAQTSEVQSVKCDQQTMCPGGTTCCKKDSGQWACCPLPQAVCCSDHEHCCPKGYKCNVAEQTCDKPGELSVSWLLKTPALQSEADRAVSVPARAAKNACDAQTSCPRDTTCCFMEKSHKWGCCPLPKAVCCEDGNHCCPNGHTCEPHRSSCSRGPHVISWFEKVSALTEPDAVTDVKCDNKSSCASGTTCCKLPSGEWGCCPLVKAVCCADHEHCCPQGYTCNMETKTCEKKIYDLFLQSLPQFKVVQSEAKKAGDEAGVLCDSAGEFRCSKQETCCKISDSEWSCCPSPRAVCCPDLKHCCPVGYSCDPKAGGCSLETQPTWDTLFGKQKKDFIPHKL
ncbi:granulin b [Mugil cephalus]|uniref:granulin b n=1 Tax=Mugil cephalus TaxID=48193 RepID=UPI001FB659CC|nr:granulin b [Mugil cephalus]